MSLSLERWIGKIAVITGASSGIGAEIADQFVEKGLIVVGLARRAELIEKCSGELQNKKGKLYAIKTDVSKESEILKAFQWVSDNLGPVSVLVNNAGIFVDSSLTDGNTSDWKQMFDINVLSLCICTREAVKIMNENNIAGHIIHISGISGHHVPNIPRMNVLPAVKHAITALTETLRLELNNLKSKIKISVSIWKETTSL